MKIVIADDETWVRTTIRNMLLELDVPIDIVGEASNGEELIQMAHLHQPQLVFVDIRMPILNGLEAIQASKELTPFTKWVILSGSSDFHYAQEAIRLGAKNYLVKPVDRKSLSACVDEMIVDCNKDLLKLNEEFEYVVSSYAWGNRSFTDLADIHSFHLFSVLLCFDSSLSESLKMQLIQKWMSEIHSYSKKTLLDNDIRYAIINLRDGDYAMICAWNPLHRSKMLDFRSKLVAYVTDKMTEYQTDYFALTAFQSELCEHIDVLLEQIAQLQSLSSLRAIFPHSGLWSWKDVSFYKQNDPKLFELSQCAEKLSHLYQENDYLPFMKELDHMERQLLAIPEHQQKIKNCLGEFLNTSIKKIIETQDDTKEWMKALRGLGEKLLTASSKKEVSHHELIQQVIQYIEKHYMDDIGIHQIASILHITPNYLSSLFSKRCGVTFSKYVTQIRMHKAKELLIADSGMRVQEIAKQLGYYSSSHFIKIFSELHGCSPIQFREQYHKK
ncbi:helix-turn-helix domain-containing protein [Paenibacillus andongensis]|uniref:helix-turn-helix domain-containing protein n=1 Tax=Paenibacillus andongensis TaxID=2975482 RepID=UPI0021BB5208|nr:helix-turn-helix domain-containing protein [Paenibacillus andongensis]